MNSKLLLRLLVLLVIPALACQLSGPTNNLPPTDTPAPVTPPTATSVGSTTGNNGLFILNLSQSDAEGLLNRANQIYQHQINSGGEVSRTVLLDAYAALATYKHVGGQWSSVGPAPIQGVNLPQGQVPGSGRTNGFAVDPRDSKVVYAAISIGGIWKTTDAGQTWASLTDNQVPLIYGGIVIDPKNPDILYAPLGEMDGSVAVSYGFLANGIMRTRDAGKTWQLVGQDSFLGAAVTSLVIGTDGKLYASSGQTGVEFGPDNMPDFGIFSSADGGDTWQRLAACSDFGSGSCVPQTSVAHPSLLGGFFDLKVGGDGTLYASQCVVNCLSTSLIRSKDGGKTWGQMDISGPLAAWEKANKVSIDYLDDAHKLPRLYGFAIAVSATDPKILLAGGGMRYLDKGGKKHYSSWVLRSTDSGDTWEWLPKAGDYCTGSGHTPQCAYDNVIRIDPTDPKVMYVGGSFVDDPDTYNWVAVLERSDDGGGTWTDLTPAVAGSFMHPDMHGFAFDPNDPKVLWVGTDGGVYRTQDASAQPPQWDNLSNGLDTLLMIDVALHPTDPNYLLAGMQDNAMAVATDRKTWQGTSFGDGAYVAVDPFKPKTVYGSIYAPHIFQRNSEAGLGPDWSPKNGSGYNKGLAAKDNWPFYPPFTVDPNNEGVLYLGSNRIYRTDDRGDSWKPTSDFLNKDPNGAVQCIVLAPSDSNSIYAGTTDGLAWASTDGAQTWNNVSGTSFPPRNLNRIAVDPNDPKTVYAVFGGFNVQTPDTPGHVFVSHDGGSSWDDITGNLPDAPLSAVIVDTRDKYAGVYVGGALGVWVLQKGSQQWLPYGTGMPLVLVTSLKLNPTTGVMAASTYGHSAWVIDMP